LRNPSVEFVFGIGVSGIATSRNRRGSQPCDFVDEKAVRSDAADHLGIVAVEHLDHMVVVPQAVVERPSYDLPKHLIERNVGIGWCGVRPNAAPITFNVPNPSARDERQDA
jgi:hypothetical protein